MEAARLIIKEGWSTREVARHTGFDHSSVVRWVQKAKLARRRLQIPTLSSRPHHHPLALSSELVSAVLAERQKHGRCAEVIHYQLIKGGYDLSLSSVKRTLKRHHLTYPSQWKKWHRYPERPRAERPGILVEIDFMREGLPSQGLYAYALIDVCSRWAYAQAEDRANSWKSVAFYRAARAAADFDFLTIQSDHGSEFAKWFSKQLISDGINHRHSRVRRPTDNGHVERFIRTLQQECLARGPDTLRAWNRAIPEFIHYYNHERPHMGLGMQTPMEVVQRY
jgi:transposase InsO family protein